MTLKTRQLSVVKVCKVVSTRRVGKLEVEVGDKVSSDGRFVNCEQGKMGSETILAIRQAPQTGSLSTAALDFPKFVPKVDLQADYSTAKVRGSLQVVDAGMAQGKA